VVSVVGTVAVEVMEFVFTEVVVVVVALNEGTVVVSVLVTVVVEPIGTVVVVVVVPVLVAEAVNVEVTVRVVVAVVVVAEDEVDVVEDVVVDELLVVVVLSTVTLTMFEEFVPPTESLTLSANCQVPVVSSEPAFIDGIEEVVQLNLLPRFE
jgi:hypothetical protein